MRNSVADLPRRATGRQLRKMLACRALADSRAIRQLQGDLVLVEASGGFRDGL
jgi:hypothetical protein